MSAAELRSAAKLIRERAQAATPGTWRAFSKGTRDDCDWYVVSAPYGQITTGMHTAADDDDDGRVTELLLIERDHCDAEHIAGMHPLVAMAVADWLDGVAEQHRHVTDTPECPSCGEAPCGPHPEMEICTDCGDDWPCAWAEPALKVARAYLGAES